MPTISRLARALARDGLTITRDADRVLRIRDERSRHLLADILLPDSLALERKALRQLVGLARLGHPDGGHVERVVATPDFHPGKKVPIGSVVATSADMVVPQAIGTDIHCGMRLHTIDLDLDAFEAHREGLVERLRGDLLLGTRDLPLPVPAMRALLGQGLMGLVEALGNLAPAGVLGRADRSQLGTEIERVYELGSHDGRVEAAPDDLVPSDRGEVRDSYLGTLGGGNHFLEIQVVERVLDGAQAWAWGVREGQLAVMIHTGSRAVGMHIGGAWHDRARRRWPGGLAHPASGVFPLHGADVQDYLRDAATAANYASANRLCLAEIVRGRFRELWGDDLACPLVWDAAHNLVERQGDLLVHRKGATPAHAGAPVLIPGSMGQASWLMRGEGHDRFLASASHGAGRATSRFAMGRRARAAERAATARDGDMRSDGSTAVERALGLDGVTCVTLRPERRVAEAPAAYKPIQPVIDIQVAAGLVSPVAELRPLITFKA